jgi:hypothetical protein
MASCDWFKMMWTSKNLMWKFNFDTQVSKLTSTYGIKQPSINKISSIWERRRPFEGAIALNSWQSMMLDGRLLVETRKDTYQLDAHVQSIFGNPTIY